MGSEYQQFGSRVVYNGRSKFVNLTKVQLKVRARYLFSVKVTETFMRRG